MTLQSLIAADFANIAADTGACGSSVVCTMDGSATTVTVYATHRVPDISDEYVEEGAGLTTAITFDLPRATVSAAFSRDIAVEDTITFDGSVYAVIRTSPDVGIIRCYCLLTTRTAAATDGNRLARSSG